LHHPAAALFEIIYSRSRDHPLLILRLVRTAVVLDRGFALEIRFG